MQQKGRWPRKVWMEGMHFPRLTLIRKCPSCWSQLGVRDDGVIYCTNAKCGRYWELSEHGLLIQLSEQK